MSSVKVVPIPVKMGPMTVMAYLLIGERVVVVDTGVAGQAERILACIASEGRSASDVSLILLTHGHGDHAGSAEALRAATGAKIALGSGDEEKCAAGRDGEMHARGLFASGLLSMIQRRQASSPTPGPAADVVIQAEQSLREYGVDAVVLPTPGHSTGSLSVMTADGDALVGDLIGGAGRSRPEPRRGVFVCDEAAMETSIQEVLARHPRLVYTGHDDHPFSLAQLAQAFGPA